MMKDDMLVRIASFVVSATALTVSAQAQGVRFGRPRWKPTPAFITAAEAAKRGELPWSKAARDCGMNESNFRYHAQTLTSLAKQNRF